MLTAYQNTTPRIHPSAFIAEGAMIIGDVTIGEKSSVWFNCVLRGDVDRIEIGARSNIQDGTVVHMDKNFPAIIGDDVTIGHGAIIHGCSIGDGAMISMGAIILTGAKIGSGAIVGAGAVVREGQEIPAKSMAVGIPARIRRDATAEELERMRLGKDDYVLRGQLMKEAKES
ncbi:MAG: gamma carbonic anhydrase family protein [Candidatus Poribacteria bacterium]|nr:gamma carbonic anhydrase family protein [Candidatus Poribacteria bacterium]